ncbi:XRE family transcriptional regulator [Solwaraspora sp. WMMD791]|uniref:XRE family transcriptional regulator n=1 Tax=Solwaraspora sp. WMMD791 TaxID=3016086 RepID=UPI00249B3925|nr:XRE family transcriptional regulator [Solwaraspora sp. WMMD791]WFE29640.1 XRE family transcriptional regulator [Solwaraspora sp. WMMD791]
MRTHAGEPLPSDSTLIRNWKRWEAGDSEPDQFYKTLIAKTFGTVTAAFFPREGRSETEGHLLQGTGMGTLEILARIRASDVSQSTLDALKIAADRLCCEYPYMSPEQLQVEGRSWLNRVTALLGRRLTLAQHREILNVAGWIALLVGCVEYDMGMRREAEATRKAALTLGNESGNGEVVAWAHEMRAWYALTQGDYRGVVVAARTGTTAAPRQGVAVQLEAQSAKAWARMGDRRQVETALDRGRKLLESLPYPEDTDHHFVVDPAKFDFYAMDCYRIVGEDSLAEMYAREVIRSSTAPDGTVRKPMRVAEAQVTLGVVAARSGDVEQATAYGHRALDGDRKSLPSLILCSNELSRLLARDHPYEPTAADYLEKLRSLRF